MTIRGKKMLAALVFLVAAVIPMTFAQDSQPGGDSAASVATEAIQPPPANTAPIQKLIAPDFSETDVSWIAAAIVLTLLVQVRPIFSLRNLDALVLALMCLSFPLRLLGATAVEGDTSARPVQFYAYAALTAFTVYWLIRGLSTAFARRIAPFVVNAGPAGLSILVAASLALGLNALFTQPVSESSRYAMAGGMYFRDTGKLPYGEMLGRDGESPLNYLLHAGATKLLPPIHEEVALAWSNREQWLASERLEGMDVAAARLVNGVLFILLFAGVAWLGKRLHTFSMGKTAAAVLCVLPATHACLGDPSIMLPAVLVTWGLAAATLPGVGFLLGCVLVVMAGLASPWAWLVLLPLVAYSMRRGWQAFGAVVGTLAGAAACLAIVYAFTPPALPRPDRAIAAVGERPAYSATVSGGQLMIERWPETAAPEAPNPVKQWFWNLLLDSDTATMRATNHSLTLPVGVDPQSVRYRDVAPSPAALGLLQPDYQTAVAVLPDGQRLLIAIRTVLEAVWLGPEGRSGDVPPVWDVWVSEGTPTSRAESTTLIRRVAKGVVGFIALLVAIVLLRRETVGPQALLGGVLAITAGIALCSTTGAVGDALWWIPALLGAIAAGGEPIPAPLFTRPGVRGPAAADHERITVE